MDAYIVGGYRSAVAKAPRGGFRFLRPLKLSHNDLSNRDKKNTTTGEKYLANSL